jgi:hypothetical protein
MSTLRLRPKSSGEAMKKILGSQKFLAIYSGVLTLVFTISVLGGFTADSRKPSFDEITVHRINIVEPDGTLRMVLSDKAAFPGIILHGKEHPHPDRKTAGMLFFNDEGTENGGLIFGGEMKDGKGSSFGHLSFDAYDQDQIFTIDAGKTGDQSASALAMVDRPEYPISELVALTDRIKNFPEDRKEAEIAGFLKAHGAAHQRLFLGRNEDKSVALRLKDVDGHDRAVLEVAADGSPVLRLLDKDGKVVSQLPATK